MMETGDELTTVCNQKLVNEIVEDKLILELLMSALDKLTKDERHIIDEIYFNDKTERQLAEKLNVSQPAIYKRRIKILEKLKNFLGL